MLCGCSKNDSKEYVTPEYSYTETTIATHVVEYDNYCLYERNSLGQDISVGEPYEVPYYSKTGYVTNETYCYYKYSAFVNGVIIEKDISKDIYILVMQENAGNTKARLYGQVNKGDVIEIMEIRDAFE